MQRTVVAVFEDPARAHEAMAALERAGVSPSDVGVVASERAVKSHPDRYARAKRDAESGAEHGAAIGGIAGLLLALTPIGWPGAGIVLAGGWIAAAVAGAAVGAAVGAARGLIDLGLPQAVASQYAERVRQGAVLVTVRTGFEQEGEVTEILRRAGADDVHGDSAPASAGS